MKKKANRKKKKDGKIISFFKNNKFKIIAFTILWLYTYFVFFMQTIYCDIEMTLLFAIFLIFFSAGFSLTMLYIFNHFLDFDFKDYNTSKKKMVLSCIIVFLITFGLYMLCFAAQYPGGMVDDTNNQLTQAYTGIYSNWHPVLHTLLFFTLPIKLGGNFSTIVFLQLLYLCLAFTYLFYSLYKVKCPKVLLYAIITYIWVNPYLFTYMMVPWKDTAMTIFAVILFGFYIQIICTKGEWLLKKRNIILFSIVAVVCTYMRHNAILFTGPLILFTLFRVPEKKKKIRFALIISMASLYISVRVLYSCIGVISANLRTLETVGLPVAIWSNVMQKNPDALPEETQEVMLSFASLETYKFVYTTGSFNSLKWSGEMDNDKIDELSYSEVLYYTWQCFKYAPKESIQAFSKLTGLVWAINGDDLPPEVVILDNDYGITSNPVEWCYNIFIQLRDFFSMGAGEIIFGSFGFMNLAMIIVGMALLYKKRISIMHAIPLLCYNFGTMLLLSGRDNRFFIFTIPLWIPTIFLMVKDKKEWSEVHFTKPSFKKIKKLKKSKKLTSAKS